MAEIFPQKWLGAVSSISFVQGASGGDSLHAVPEKCIVAVKNTSAGALNLIFKALGPAFSNPVNSGLEYRAQVAVTGVYAVGDKVPVDYGNVYHADIYAQFSVPATSTVLVRPNIEHLDISSGKIEVSYEAYGDMEIAVVALPIRATLFHHARYQALLYPQT